MIGACYFEAIFYPRLECVAAVKVMLLTVRVCW